MVRALCASLVAASTAVPPALSADDPSVRLVRASSGSRGSVQGTRYIIEDPRTSFEAGKDRQIVVLFEFEAPPGTHAGQASWKDPSGAVVLVAPFQQSTPGRRFSVYWTLALPDAPRLGLWAVEAVVDGHSAGVHTFQIQGSGGGAATVQRRPLTAPELYGNAQAGTLSVDALDAQGKRLASGSGFLVEDGLVMTAFQLIEGASRVRVGFYGKPPVETDDVSAWNRHQDWAVLRAPSLGPPPLAAARDRTWKVGDRCAFLDTGADGARVMADAVIVGAQDFPKAGPRLSINAQVNARAIGGPLLNEYGEPIAVLGGALTPGLTMTHLGSGAFVPLSLVTNTFAVPLAGLPALGGPGAKLHELAARGLFVPPLVGPVNVLTGTIALGIEKRNGVPMPVNEKSDFSRSEREAVAFLTFDPQEKRQGMASFQIYDTDNRKIMEGKPSRMVLRPRQYAVSTWQFPLEPLAPGFYRIDLVLDAHPVWRSFFRILD
jgi:S1-C subfamily serine protease